MNRSKSQSSDCKIAHVITESGPFGGAQRNTLVSLKGLVRDGYRVELICGGGGRLIEEARAIGVPVRVIPELIRRVHPPSDAAAFFRLWACLRSQRYRIVHTHSTKAGLLGRLAAWLARVPVIVHTVHGVPFPIDGGRKARVYLALERMAAGMSDAIVCVGEILRREVSSWKMAPERKLATIYSGLEFASYVPACAREEARRRFGVERAWPVVGCVGRLSEAKAQYDLVEAAALLKKKYPCLHLLLAGEGELRPRLERQIVDAGMTGQVSLLGERRDVADLLNVLDVYAMCSRWEGVGRALSEAMLWGLPIVAAPVNGVKELIVHEQTGLLASPCDPARLASAIDRLASDRGLARRLGCGAQKKAKELMDSESMIAELEELYGRLIWMKLARRAAPVLSWGGGLRANGQDGHRG